MILAELTQVAPATLPVAELRDHLRLGTGFSDDGGQDAFLRDLIGSALKAVEARTGKVVLRRTFRWTLTAWRGLVREVLPVAPVTSLSALRITEADGAVEIIAPDRYVLEPDSHRPFLAGRGGGLPVVPVAGRIEVDFEAGYGADWSGVPDDLARAVLMLAAHYHEQRHAAGSSDLRAVPEGLAALLAPYRPLRLFERRG